MTAAPIQSRHVLKCKDKNDDFFFFYPALKDLQRLRAIAEGPPPQVNKGPGLGAPAIKVHVRATLKAINILQNGSKHFRRGMRRERARERERGGGMILKGFQMPRPPHLHPLGQLYRGLVHAIN